MNHKKKVWAGLLLGTLLLSGCSRNTKTQVVMPREQNEKVLLAKESNVSLAEQIQAPVRYQVSKELNGFHLQSNARVMVPDVEGIKLKKIKSRNFTEEDMKNIQDVLFGGDYYYALSNVEMNEEMETADKISSSPRRKEKRVAEAYAQDAAMAARREVSKEAVQVEYGNPLPADCQESSALLRDFLDGKKSFVYNRKSDLTMLYNLFLESSNQQPDWVGRKKIWDLRLASGAIAERIDIHSMERGNLWEQGGLRDNETLRYKEGVVVSPEALYEFHMNNGNGEMEYLYAEMRRPYLDVVSENVALDMNAGMNNVRLQEENLADLNLQKSRDLVEALGFEDAELAAMEDQIAVYWDYIQNTKETFETRALGFLYTPVVDGVPITMFHNVGDYKIQEDGMTQWPYEQISYGKEGLLSFQWTSPSTVEDWHDEYAFLLPFSEIQKIFEELLGSNYESAASSLLFGEITISEVRLGYAKVVSKDLLREDSNRSVVDENVVYTGVLVPVWDFIGPAEGAMADMHGVTPGTKVSYMTINAMDGSIIQR